MKEQLIKNLYSEGACAVGVVRARKFDELREILEKRGRVSLCPTDIEQRINPFYLMPEAKSIVVCLFSYFVKEECEISAYAVGKDYHTVVKNKLNAGAKIIRDNGFLADAYVDNAPLPDRYLAYLAGLGFFGRNTMLINEKYGSMVFIGYILTDCELLEDSPLENTYCMDCKKCISACPGGAIGENFDFNEDKCVSYLTQKKGELTKDEEDIIKKSGYIWGCDICQRVCPYNYTPLTSQIPEFIHERIDKIDDLDDLSNKEFKKLYSERAFSWRGKAVLKRNMDLYK